MSKQLIELTSHAEPNRDFCNLKVEGKFLGTFNISAHEAKDMLDKILDKLDMENTEVRISVK